MNENILKLKLYKPPPEVEIPAKAPYKRRISPISILFVLFVGAIVFLVALKWESIVNLAFKPKAIYYGFIEKIKYKPPQPDTTRQKQIADSLSRLAQKKEPTQINVIDSLKLSIRWKRGIIDFLRYYHPGLNPKRIYSIDDEYLVVEGQTKTRAYLDTVIEVSIFKGAGIYADIIETTRTKLGTNYTVRITKQPVERTWDDNYVSIPPYKRKEVIELLDSLKSVSGISGEFIPLDEENHIDFTRYIVEFKGYGTKNDILEFLQSIDKLDYYVQILSIGIEFGVQRARLLMLIGLNYLVSKTTAQQGEQTNTPQ